MTPTASVPPSGTPGGRRAGHHAPRHSHHENTGGLIAIPARRPAKVITSAVVRGHGSQEGGAHNSEKAPASDSSTLELVRTFQIFGPSSWSGSPDWRARRCRWSATTACVHGNLRVPHFPDRTAEGEAPGGPRLAGRRWSGAPLLVRALALHGVPPASGQPLWVTPCCRGDLI